MYLKEICRETKKSLETISKNNPEEVKITKIVSDLMQDIDIIQTETPNSVYDNYSEFFANFRFFCEQCLSYVFYNANKEMFISSLELFLECLDAIDQECPMLKCICCAHTIRVNMPEEEYPLVQCPKCGAEETERRLISLLKEKKMQEAPEESKVLHFAPTKPLVYWMVSNCPHIDYQTAKSYRDNSGQEFLQDVSGIPDNYYDIIINPHLFADDVNCNKVMSELKRILKPAGKMVCFSVGHEEKQALGKYYVVRAVSGLYVITKSEDVVIDFGEDLNCNEELRNDGPLVSVILPCYNHEKYVGAAIESVIHQTYKNIEILVADDASTDRSVNEIKKYSSFLTEALFYDENKGGRELELKAIAKGKYIALMHSDDVWEPEKIALQVNYMEKHPECGVCLTWCKYVDEEMNEIENHTFIKANRERTEWMRYFWQEGNALCNPSSLVRREYAWDYPQYGSICRQLPDFFKWVYLIQKMNIYIVPRVLVKMKRISSIQNVSSSTNENTLRLLLEEGSTWMWIIREMEDDFFIESFRELMINPNANGREQIQCEKYFLLLKHNNPFVQNSAFVFLDEVFNEIADVIKKDYFYTKKEIADDMLKRGLVPFLKNDNSRKDGL